MEEIADSLGELISRDEDGMNNKFQVHDSYDIGGIFKAVGVKVADDRYLDRMSGLPDVTSIIPDDEIQFDLPFAEKRKIDKRYYIVSKHSTIIAPSKYSCNMYFYYSVMLFCPTHHTKTTMPKIRPCHRYRMQPSKRTLHIQPIPADGHPPFCQQLLIVATHRNPPQ